MKHFLLVVFYFSFINDALSQSIEEVLADKLLKQDLYDRFVDLKQKKVSIEDSLSDLEKDLLAKKEFGSLERVYILNILYGAFTERDDFEKDVLKINLVIGKNTLRRNTDKNLTWRVTALNLLSFVGKTEESYNLISTFLGEDLSFKEDTSARAELFASKLFNVYYLSGRFNKYLEILEKTQSQLKGPERIPLVFRRAEIFNYFKRADESLDLLQRYFPNKTNPSLLYYPDLLKVEAYIHLKEYEQADSLIREIQADTFNHTPRMTQIYLRLKMLIAHQLKECAKVQEAYKIFQDKTPKKYRQHTPYILTDYFGKLLTSVKSLKEARASIRKKYGPFDKVYMMIREFEDQEKFCAFLNTE